MSGTRLPEAGFPPPPARVFLVGVCGIGMSGLAQLLRHEGYAVGGSDRDLDGPGRAGLAAKLRGLGVGLWPQDGSGISGLGADVVVCSSAIEAGNPDLQAAGGRPRYGRAAALAAALERIEAVQIAVAGSCGKTTVTGWLASTLRTLGQPVLMVCGGIVNEFETAAQPGNFAATDRHPAWLVYEVDESDASLVQFTPDYGVVLNIGTDHFDRVRLCELFSAFLGRCRRSVVIDHTVRDDVTLPPGLAVAEFADRLPPHTVPGVLHATTYAAGADGIRIEVPEFGSLALPQFGRHSAANALAVLCVLHGLQLSCSAAAISGALAAFGGVRQRFELLGRTPVGVPVYNDYAHNPEKIRAALATAQELSGGRPVLALFQPHGYGPLGFMRDALRDVLAETLRPEDRFVFLPVYYVGGTTSFSPTAGEVAEQYREAGLAVEDVPERAAAARLVAAAPAGTGAVLVMGARDPTLYDWTRATCRGSVCRPACS